MRTRTDRLLLALTGLCVAGLAIVAGAISFAHMVELAQRHDQTGWKAYAFPVSVDGLEIVASLYLVVQRRAGRPTGWVPWVALVVGTLASLAANVAVGGHDPIGKALAGWPALSMLVSVKLLFSMIDHGDVDQRTVRDDQRPADDRSLILRADPDDGASSGLAADGRTGNFGPFVIRGTDHNGGAPPRRSTDRLDSTVTVEVRSVAHLIPAARAARAALTKSGRSLSRDALADVMRDDGHGVSNARASLLLKVLKAEESSRQGAEVTGATKRDPDSGPDLAGMRPTVAG
ncbi:DUF2637 domain-containing protein [Plantactinospora sp. ZYX-F-223]|uniref:DUF2637 domain-containing protein n=1 Tax=Plantactinospora sp. ZYX-F-223 TaxID=3144103 RepID=UPI0031FBD567